MKYTITALLLCSLFSATGLAQTTKTTYHLSPSDISGGYFVKKIWLEQYGAPAVDVSDISYTDCELPANATAQSAITPQVFPGMERKRPFAVIRIPAFTKTKTGQIRRVTEFSMSVDQQSTPATVSNTAKKTTGDVTTSVLASGKWYKIGITETGFHKIDASFISAMGVDPNTIDASNIRIYGNGGKMLSESNSVARPSDLIENAILVNDGGDNKIGSGDYVIFYGQGPMGWDFDGTTNRFKHLKNLYTDTAYYFICFDKGPGLRITSQNANGGGNVNVSEYNYFAAIDNDLESPAGIGKTWYGEQFNPIAGNLTQSFNINPGAPVSNIYCEVSLSTSGPSGNSFDVILNGNLLSNVTFPSGTTENTVIQTKSAGWSTTGTANSANVSLTFKPSGSASLGYLNYIEINATKQLAINKSQINFRAVNSVGTGNVAVYSIQGADAQTIVWDVTDPQVPIRLNGALNGNTYTFSQDANALHEFAAMKSTDLFSPSFSGTVANQNLHGMGQVDDIIITHKDFLSQAEQLAEYHRQHDNLKVVVATPEQVYNEFSSGGQDICAIRDFARMFYKRAGTDTTQMPRYLTLLGSGSYDYKDRLPNNSNYVPVFESAESSFNLASFSTDDFYGFLDDNENIEDHSIFNTLDIGIGRLPARSVSDAQILVDKISSYKKPETLGPWRIASTLVADNADGAGNHLQDAEDMATHITATTHNLYNHSKIYLDAIPTISTPAGQRAPNASAAISDRVFKGTMLINYTGHGNTQVWAEERILTQDDYSKWNNANMLPFMVTATCDFGQFDHPQYVSAAERLVLKKGGGVISILTTTAPVYASYNNPLNGIFLTSQLSQNPDGSWNSFGDASRIGKNARYLVSNNISELSNYRKFALLGDPALVPNFPEYFVEIDGVTDVATSTHADTIKALGEYRIEGRVNDNDGNTLTNFNGVLSVSIYDKPRIISCITSLNQKFKLQDNLVYKGKVTVTNGRFSYSFIAPKDINYYYGTGKISNYAQNDITDAAGVDTNFTVGGFSDNPVISDVPPIVKPYINDSLFQNGGITGANTSLFVALYSETGINVSGNKLGHDMTAILDGNNEQPYLLNDYYETAPNTYKRGFVTFPIAGLANGKHTIVVKAWDVNNNSGQGSVDFTVLDGKIVGIEQLSNYPNPFSDETHFVFEHNHPDEALDVKINIYNTAGTLVSEIRKEFTPTGSRTNEITWKGTDNNGMKLPSGMYVYRIMITTNLGYKSTAYQKLVIVR